MMVITEISLFHHLGLVLFLLWFFSHMNFCPPIVYFASLIYLYLVHERYMMRLKKKLQYQERKDANHRRLLSDTESVRWLNYAVEKIWLVCLEHIVSQKILLPIIPWFLEKYKPWTAKEAMIQHLYLGRNPPMLTDFRVLRQPKDDDHLVMELGMNFLTAEDMSAIISVKLRKRLGFGMWAKLHVTGMHIEGKVLVGVKFLRNWPFLGRLRVCFVEPPYFQMTVKPIFTHGLDVTELPGIAGWLDKLLSIAFEQTLVEPNMLVVDVEKFAAPQPENWFSVDEKEPRAYAKIEVVEATDMQPSDLNGLADPYVKGQLGPFKFKTITQKKTLNPKWHEEFKIPIFSWESPNVLSIDVLDKDHLYDDALGCCSIDISDLRDGHRHDMWISLQNIKTGRLHIAITVVEVSGKVEDRPREVEAINEDFANSFASGRASISSVSSEMSPRMLESFEPIDIEGQNETGIWVHHPGTHISQTWKPRQGKSRRLDTKIKGGSIDTSNSPAAGSYQNESSSNDENGEGSKSRHRVRRGLHKIGSVFGRSSKKVDRSVSFEGDSGPSPRTYFTTPHADPAPSPLAKSKSPDSKEIRVRCDVDDLTPDVKIPKLEGSSSPKGSSSKTPSRVSVKGTKSMVKNAGKHIRHALSRKGTRKDLSAVKTGGGVSSDEDSSLQSPFQYPASGFPVVSNSSSCSDSGLLSVQEDNADAASAIPAINSDDTAKKEDNADAASVIPAISSDDTMKKEGVEKQSSDTCSSESMMSCKNSMVKESVEAPAAADDDKVSNTELPNGSLNPTDTERTLEGDRNTIPANPV